MKILVETSIKADLQTVWNAWTTPEHIIKWNFASPEWHCPNAVIDLKPGGMFSYHMAAKDGSMDFEFNGTFHTVINFERITFSLGDDRLVEINFKSDGTSTTITETFEAEDELSGEQQRAGWQAILNNFKSYVENI